MRSLNPSSEEIMSVHVFQPSIDRIHDWNHDHPVRLFRVRDAAETRRLTMNLMLFAILFAADAGGAATVAVDPAHDPVFKNFVLCMWGGSLGLVFGMSLYRGSWKLRELQPIAQELVGNLMIAIMLGPWATFWVAARTGYDANAYLFVPVSGFLGVAGVNLYKVTVPLFWEWLKRQSGLSKAACPTDPQ